MVPVLLHLESFTLWKKCVRKKEAPEATETCFSGVFDMWPPQATAGATSMQSIVARQGTWCLSLRIENRPRENAFFKMSKMVHATQRMGWGWGVGGVITFLELANMVDATLQDANLEAARGIHRKDFEGERIWLQCTFFWWPEKNDGGLGWCKMLSQALREAWIVACILLT